MSVPKWVKSFWEGFGKKLQPAYKRIDEWDSPWLRQACSGLWNVLDDEMKKQIYNFVMTLVKKYGEDFAKKLVESVLGSLRLRYDVK